MMMTWISGSVLATTLLCCGSGTAAHAADLHVLIDGVATGDGTVEVALFDGDQDFPDRHVRGISVPAAVRAVTVVFAGVPPGRYALSAYQDRNGNGKLDRSFTGRPKEPYGFSRDARGVFGPPTFAEAAFDVTTGDTTIQFKIQ